jgi:hypothetical protein
LNIYARSTLVIYGLDECNPDSRYELVEALTSLLSDAEKPVKIFVLNRPESGHRRGTVGGVLVSALKLSTIKDNIRKHLDTSLTN